MTAREAFYRNVRASAESGLLVMRVARPGRGPSVVTACTTAAIHATAIL